MQRWLALCLIVTPLAGQMPRLPESSRPSPRPNFLTGKVFLEDGAGITAPIAILGGCRGTMASIGYTDLNGRFAITLGQGNRWDDASQSNSKGGGPASICELAARLEGYRSAVVTVDDSSVGTILLHRLGDHEGGSVSMTSLLAPKDAKKAFDRGMEAARKERYDEAAKQFQKAVAAYPKYADAWFQLGHVQCKNNQLEAARISLARASVEDGKLVAPYVDLAALYANGHKWQESIGNARHAIQLDVNHRFAQAHRILGTALAGTQDYAGAAAELRAYLKLLPEAKDAGEVRAQLAELERH